tara:strand:- start:2239 stop:2661 length:423 start_codon:yes stop_codon:yes gene_type:complete
MIKYSLQCKNLHQFESWFRTSDDYEKLNNEKMLSCEICGSKSISKSLMAPRVSSNEKKQNKKTLESIPSKEQKLIKQLKKEVEKNCEYVGDNFEKEARAIHYGDSPERSIYGKTTLKQAKSLYEDGIPVTPLPWVDRKTN